MGEAIRTDKVRMEQEHEFETRRLEGRMKDLTDEWEDQKARLDVQMVREKDEMRRQQDDFQAQCDRQMQQTKAEMNAKMEDWRLERERLEDEKKELARATD